MNKTKMGCFYFVHKNDSNCFLNFCWPAKTSRVNAPHFAVGGLKSKLVNYRGDFVNRTTFKYGKFAFAKLQYYNQLK